MDLTEVQKLAISEKLNKELNTLIMPGEAGRRLGIPGNYISMMRNPEQFKKCPKSGWEAAFHWFNSGQKLCEYSPAHSNVGAVQAHDKMPPKELAQEITRAFKHSEQEKPLTPKEVKGEKIKKSLPEIEVVPPSTECIEELDAVKIKIVIDLQIYVNGQEVKLN